MEPAKEEESVSSKETQVGVIKTKEKQRKRKWSLAFDSPKEGVSVTTRVEVTDDLEKNSFSRMQEAED